jgi:hypothetical protein
MDANYAMKDNVDFVVEEGAKNRKDKVYVLPVAAIYGSNAGGKSNVIFALRDAVKNVCRRRDWIFNDPFMLVDKEHISGEFEHTLNVILNNHEYEYSYSANNQAVISEELKKKSIGAKEFDTIFTREIDEVTNGSILEESYSNTIKNAASNTGYLIVNTVGTMDIPDCSSIYNWCKSIHFHISNKSDAERREHLDEYASDLATNGVAKKRVTDFINKFDPAVEEIEAFESRKDVPGKKDHILGVGHKYTKVDGSADIMFFSVRRESNGTKKILELYPVIADALDNGKILVIDELDTMLHPLVFKRIIAWFNDKNTNPNKAQLIFTAHNTEVLNREDLRRDEIHIVEKKSEGVSEIFRLSDVEDEDGNKIRSDARYDRLYLEGLLGSVPSNFHDASV